MVPHGLFGWRGLRSPVPGELEVHELVVRGEHAGLAELRRALAAAVGALAGVRADVSLQYLITIEYFVTSRTGVLEGSLVPLVRHPDVLLKRGRAHVRLVAAVALERPDVQVYPVRVLLQISFDGETLLAM